MINQTLDAIAIAMRDNFSDISFSIAFHSALNDTRIDLLTLSKMFDADPHDIDLWYSGDSFPVQSKRSMILGMLLQSLVIHEEA